MWPPDGGHKSHMGRDEVGQRPRELTPNAGPWHHLGAEMRDWRKHRRLSLGKLSEKILFNTSYMARAERADQRPSADLVTAYEQALDAGGSLVRAYRQIVEAPEPGGSSRVHVSKPALDVSNGHVAMADEMDLGGPSSEGISVPARTDDGRIIFVSMSRRALLGALGTAAASTAFADPAAVAASPSMRPSLSGANPIEHLEATHGVLVDSDKLFGPYQSIPIVERQIAAMKFLRQDLRGEDRRRLLQLHARYAELAGWLHQDTRNFRSAQHWMREALEISHLTNDPQLTTFILARRSQLAGDMHDPLDALDVAEAAEQHAEPGSRLAAVAATYGAHAHALRGAPDACMRAYEHAHDLRQSMDPDPVDEIHLVVAPLVVGQADAPRFLNPADYPWPATRRMTLAEARTVGDVVLLRYLPKQESDA